MTQLLLIRHGKTDWVGDRLAGLTPGIPLNAAGRAEAVALAARLSDTRIDAVYASPLDRTRETAEYVARPRGLAVTILPGVGEVDFGAWTGCKLADLRNDPLWRTVQGQPSAMRFPDGERFLSAQSRAVAALDDVRAAHPWDTVAVISHADIIKSIVAHFAGTHFDLFQRIAIDTASVSIVHFTPEGASVVLVNDTGRMPAAPKAPEPEPAPASAPATVPPAGQEE